MKKMKKKNKNYEFDENLSNKNIEIEEKKLEFNEEVKDFLINYVNKKLKFEIISSFLSSNENKEKNEKFYKFINYGFKALIILLFITLVLLFFNSKNKFNALDNSYAILNKSVEKLEENYKNLVKKMDKINNKNNL